MKKIQLITRQQAIKEGSKVYFSDRPCSKCSTVPSFRYTSNGTCINCKRGTPTRHPANREGKQ